MMEDLVNCPFTGNKASLKWSGGFVMVGCDLCGSFMIAGSAFEYLGRKKPPAQKLINCASYNLNYGQGKFPPIWYLDKKEADQDEGANPQQKFYLKETLDEPVNHSEKVSSIMELIGEKLEAAGPFDIYSISEKDKISLKISSDIELVTIFVHLLENGLVISPISIFNTLENQRNAFSDTKRLSLTVKGWDFIYENRKGIGSKNVFVAMQFKWGIEGDKDAERERQEVLQKIKEACSANGFEADLVFQNHTDDITDQIIADIKRAKFVVAEFTHHNHGVYYEAGFAKGLGKKVFHLVRTDQKDKFHFDIKQINYRDWATPEGLKEKLIPWIASQFGGEKIK